MIRTFLISAITLLIFTSCEKIEGEGAITTKNYVTSITTDQIDIESNINLTLSDQIEVGEIMISTNENIHEYITLIYGDNEITIDIDENKLSGNVIINVTASSKQFTNIEASGACDVKVVDGTPNHNNYSIELSGASTFEGDLIISNTLDIELSGSSNIKIAGSASDVDANLSGSSKIDGESFSCNDLDVDLSGSSNIKMEVNNTITGKLNGSSKINYSGNATVSVETSGTASVSKL